MNEGSSPLASALGFWMMIQLVSTLALLLGGLYALFCLSRAASGLDRLASAVEDLVARGAGNSVANLPGMTPLNVMPVNAIPAHAQSVETTSFMPTASAVAPSNVTEMPFSTPPISAAVTPASTGAAPVSYAPPAPSVNMPPPANTPAAASDSEKNDEYRR